MKKFMVLSVIVVFIFTMAGFDVYGQANTTDQQKSEKNRIQKLEQRLSKLNVMAKYLTASIQKLITEINKLNVQLKGEKVKLSKVQRTIKLLQDKIKKEKNLQQQ